ncbi:ABC transporter F family member 4 [Striga hermonthica]|uniref:ABC transporter F family member 4 n=1 Tax=Striga hermonthica TaxID=68872 RepID=A0A9N7NMQ8_STRHE|nr:ABC transporter F family member 4 [Striga hermonthica]
MVSKTEEEQVNRLETQVENGGGGAWDYLCLVRKLKLRRSDKVLKYGCSILNDPKKRSALGPEEWTLYEQVAVAAMDCQRLDLAKEYVRVLQKKFPESKRVGRLEAMLLEAQGKLAEAEKAYSSLKSKRQPPPIFFAEPNTQSNSFVGTEEYIAPEIITGEGHSSAIDWWALGILLYEMLYGRTPFRGKNRQKTFANILHKDLTFPSSIPVSLSGRQLIHALLNRDPACRLGSNGGANEIKQHPWRRVRLSTFLQVPIFSSILSLTADCIQLSPLSLSHGKAPSAASARRSQPSAACVYLLLAVTILATSPRNLILLITLAAGSTMGKKKSDEAATGTKSKQSGKEKLSVSAMLASMDSKPDKPKKGPTFSKLKPKAAPKVSSYTDGIDLPSSDEEEDDVLGSEEEQKQYDTHRNPARQTRTDARPLDINISNKELKKREKKDLFANQAAELAKQEALRDDRDAFTVVIGSRASVLDGEDEADANVKDITIDNFSVSARGKELLKNASVKISHGKRYGLVGPNGKGKSTLLKLLAWRKIPVPKNIDVLLVEQEVVGDDRTALEAVVSANEELIKLRQEVASLQDDASNVPAGEEEDDDEDDDVGEKLSELYEKLQLMGSDAAEAQASKILAGLGFTKDMQIRATRSFSGGWRMRISLARALFVQPTLLLLDEPTNHLDLGPFCG